MNKFNLYTLPPPPPIGDEEQLDEEQLNEEPLDEVATICVEL